jgi:hypothetical protein
VLAILGIACGGQVPGTAVLVLVIDVPPRFSIFDYDYAHEHEYPW